jgi:dephospho-CoA kinase
MSNFKLIIGLVGEKLAGKDTVANYLVKSKGAFHIRFTHILDEILTSLDLPLSRRNEIDLGLGLRKVFGDGVLGKAVVKRALSASEDFIVINGIRMDEMKNVKEIGAKVIYVTAPVNLRFERYKQRHEKADDGVMNLEQFVQQEKELTEIGIPELGKQADFKIENTGSVEELYKQVEEILAKF